MTGELLILAMFLTPAFVLFTMGRGSDGGG
jgi:hypothetical protein